MTLIHEILFFYLEMAPILLFGFFVAGVLNELVPSEKVAASLGKKSRHAEVKASLLGVPLPLCSCSVLPLSYTLKKLGAKNSSIVSFLTSTPQTGIDSFIVTAYFLGPIFAIFKPLCAFVVGISGGYVVKWFGHENDETLEDDTKKPCCAHHEKETLQRLPRWLHRLYHIFQYGWGTTIEEISSWLLSGILIGGLLSWILPPDFFINTVTTEFQSMLLMIVSGIPLYICATSSIPIACALLLKGLSPGAAFVFLTVGPATNVTSISVLIKTIGAKNTFLYLINITIMSIAMGLLLNALSSVFPIHVRSFTHQHLHDFSWIQIGLTVLFTLLLLRGLWKKWKPSAT